MDGIRQSNWGYFFVNLFLVAAFGVYLTACSDRDAEKDHSSDGAVEDASEMKDAAESSPEEIEVEGFKRIVAGGIDDRLNGYPWAMAQFDGDGDGTPEIYIGTVQNPLCLQVSPATASSLLSLFSGSSLNRDLSSLGLPPERWQCRNDLWDDPNKYLEESISPGRVYRGVYQPHDNTWQWTRVFSPSRDENLAFRGARVFNNALFLLGMTDTEGLVWKTTDGLSFEVVSPSGMSTGGLGVVGGLRGAQVFKDKLYVGSNSACEIFASADPSTDRDSWQQVNSTGFVDSGGDTDEAGNPINGGFWQLGVFNGYLYAGTTNLNGAELWKSDDPRPGNWTQVFKEGWGNPDIQSFMTIRPFGEYLYLGSVIYPIGTMMSQIDGCDVLRVDKDDNVELLVGKIRSSGTSDAFPLSGMAGGFDWPYNLYSWYMAEYQNEFYLGTYDYSSLVLDYMAERMGIPFDDWTDEEYDTVVRLMGPDRTRYGGADLFKTANGVDWEKINLDGFGDRDNYGIRNMLTTQWGLMVAMANPVDGFEVWLLPAEE